MSRWGVYLFLGFVHFTDMRQGASASEPTPVGVTAHQSSSFEGDHSIGVDLLTIGNDIICGPSPADSTAWRSFLRERVRTVVSVDSRPCMVKLGMEIAAVHLPMSYGYVSPVVRRQLTAIAREAPGPIYVHCRHGHRRGPAAAAFIAQVRHADEELDVQSFLTACRFSDRDEALRRLVDSAAEARSMEVSNVDWRAGGAPNPASLAMTRLQVAMDAWANSQTAGSAAVAVPLDELSAAIEDWHREVWTRRPKLAGRVGLADDYRFFKESVQAPQSSLATVQTACDRCHQRHQRDWNWEASAEGSTAKVDPHFRP